MRAKVSKNGTPSRTGAAGVSMPMDRVAPQRKNSRKTRPARAASSSSQSSATPVVHHASIYPGPGHALPPDFARAVLKLEKLLGQPVWLLVQNGNSEWGQITGPVFKGFQKARTAVAGGKPAAILIESPGGDPDFAFRIARMLQRCTGNQLTVVVPQYAKSAATLMALAAKELIVARDAELGPLDVQIFDMDREDYGSALNAVQSIERLNAVALTVVDQTMHLLARRTGKRTDVLLPNVLSYAADFLRPLLEKIDTVDYTKKSRALKLTEEYAVRLMRPNYSFPTARRIARQLVEKYPTHGFVIDCGEAMSNLPVGQQGETFGLGLSISRERDDMEEIETLMESIVPHLDELTVVGRVQEAKV